MGSLKGREYYWRFLSKRVARTYPVYLLGVLLSLFVSFGLSSIPAKLPLLAVLNIVMLHSWVPVLAMEWYGGGSWSVSTEIFFYLAFPLLMPILGRIKTAETLFVLLGVTIFLGMIPGFWYNYPFIEDFARFSLVYNFPPFRIPEFIAGILTGLLVLRCGWRVPVWGAVLALGVGSVYLALWGFKLRGHVVHIWIMLPVIVALLGCLAYSPPSIAFRWLGSRLLVYLGRVSYSFYIFQIPLLIAYGTLWCRGVMPYVAWWVVPGLFIVNLLAAMLMYELVEKPLHKWVLARLMPARLETGMNLVSPAA